MTPDAARAPKPLWVWRVRTALGVRSVVAPAIVFVPLGYLLGPTHLNVLSEAVQAHLDPVISAALVTLGVFVGLALGAVRADAGRSLAAAAVEASITAAVVASAIGFLAWTWALPGTGSAPLFGAVVGLCAAASATLVTRAAAGDRETTIARVADFDDLVVIAAGGVLVAHGGDLVATLRAATMAVAVATATAAAGWLLFESASSEPERGVFVIGTVLLLAGGAAYLHVSPLLVGTVAGALWAFAPGGAAQIVRADLDVIQHPLVVLLLLVAGATIRPTLLAAWLLAPLLIFRITGKIAGSWAAARIVRDVPPLELSARLLPCGAAGIALALNYDQLTGTGAGPAVVAALAGAAVVFEALALFNVGGEGDQA